MPDLLSGLCRLPELDAQPGMCDLHEIGNFVRF